jgi:hypothetical protein
MTPSCRKTKSKTKPQAGFEPTTFRLLSECSTPKLLWQLLVLSMSPFRVLKRRVRMAQWIRRLPTEQEILGSSPSTDLCCALFFESEKKESVEEQGIDPCASCMQSRRSTI